MRNNAKNPTLGHVIMMGTAALGWLVLFIVALTSSKQGATWWLLVLFAGAMMLASTTFALVLLRRLSRSKTSP